MPKETTLKNCNIVLLAVFGLASTAIFLPGPEPSWAATPATQESYVQEPVRNMQLGTRIRWVFEYQPADSNAAQVWTEETGPNLLREELDNQSIAEKDGNTFVPPAPGHNGQIILEVHQYSNGGTGDNFGASLMAEMWALGHKGMVCRVRTDSFHYEEDAVEDLAKRIYYWLHNGWHTTDNN
jgi:hypothetical protein